MAIAARYGQKNTLPDVSNTNASSEYYFVDNGFRQLTALCAYAGTETPEGFTLGDGWIAHVSPQQTSEGSKKTAIQFEKDGHVYDSYGFEQAYQGAEDALRLQTQLMKDLYGQISGAYSGLSKEISQRLNDEFKPIIIDIFAETGHTVTDISLAFKADAAHYEPVPSEAEDGKKETRYVRYQSPGIVLDLTAMFGVFDQPKYNVAKKLADLGITDVTVATPATASTLFYQPREVLKGAGGTTERRDQIICKTPLQDVADRLQAYKAEKEAAQQQREQHLQEKTAEYQTAIHTLLQEIGDMVGEDAPLPTIPLDPYHVTDIRSHYDELTLARDEQGNITGIVKGTDGVTAENKLPVSVDLAEMKLSDDNDQSLAHIQEAVTKVHKELKTTKAQQEAEQRRQSETLTETERPQQPDMPYGKIALVGGGALATLFGLSSDSWLGKLVVGLGGLAALAYGALKAVEQGQELRNERDQDRQPDQQLQELAKDFQVGISGGRWGLQ